MIYSSLIYPGRDALINAVLLAESIRSFAGDMSQAPVWFVFPETGAPIAASFKERFQILGVTLIPLQVAPEILSFPLACEPVAAAHVEALAIGQADQLAWLGANTIVLQEPQDFVLPEHIDLGVRPVHHMLVGSHFEKPLDPFWSRIYHVCDVPPGHIFPMTTHVDAKVIRPYINAGSLVTKPRNGLFNAWYNKFLALFQSDFLQGYYKQDWRYKVFIHQAFLIGTVLSILSPDRISILPDRYNYPLHLYGEDVSGRRPPCLGELVTFRHEGFYKDPAWSEQIPAGDALKRWLASRLPESI